MGVATGCCCKEVYRFSHITFPYSSVYICSFLQQHPYFCLIFTKCFLFLFQYFFAIKFYILNNFFVQYKYTYGRLRASHFSHMKAAHVLYTKKHTQTNASYPAMDSAVCLQGAGCISRSRGRALYRDASRAAYVLSSLPSRNGDLELDCGVNVSL